MLRMAGLILAFSWLVAETPQGWAGAACTCRANGQKYEQGQIMCIRGKLSRCSMQLNVPTWKILANTCPEARLPQSPPDMLALGRRPLPHSSLPSC